MPSIYYSIYNTHCVLLLIVNSVCGDYYHSSRSHLNNLLEIQDKLINKITYFIHQEYETLRALENYVKLLKKERTKSLEDVKTYLDNPINVFTLIKRLTFDLDLVESQIRNTTALEIDKDKYPDMDDLEGAVAAMERVRFTYQINTTEMANGILKGAKSNPLTIGDCYYLAFVLNKHKSRKNSIEWLAQALLKYSRGESTYPTRLQAILQGLVHSFEALDDNTNAELWKKRASQMSYNRESFREMAEELISWSSKFYYFDKEQRVENTLCREEVYISRKVQSKLKCYYLTYNNYFLILAPFKLEQLYIDPDVNMVHDAMNDNEIQHFIDEGKRNMTRATDARTDQNMMYRIAKIAWFDPSHSVIMDRVSKRMAHFSGCDMTCAEDLQICNYGIGGHYEAHYDHAFSEDLKSKFKFNYFGNRYATILFYLSDVTSGGATVFVKLGMTVPVKKGAAIFWRNLLPTGEGDLRTLHAACPVILGNKWVANRWVREAGQESLCTDDQKINKA